MGGQTLDKELYDVFEFCDSRPSKSALVQRRDRILPEAFVQTFYEYTSQLRKYHKWKGFNLLAVDGSRINIARDPNDSDSHRGYEGYNVFAHLHEANKNYVIRVKDSTSNSILSALDVPEGEFDKTFTLNLSSSQKKIHKSFLTISFHPLNLGSISFQEITLSMNFLLELFDSTYMMINTTH